MLGDNPEVKTVMKKEEKKRTAEGRRAVDPAACVFTARETLASCLTLAGRNTWATVEVHAALERSALSHTAVSQTAEDGTSLPSIYHMARSTTATAMKTRRRPHGKTAKARPPSDARVDPDRRTPPRPRNLITAVVAADFPLAPGHRLRNPMSFLRLLATIQ